VVLSSYLYFLRVGEEFSLRLLRSRHKLLLFSRRDIQRYKVPSKYTQEISSSAFRPHAMTHHFGFASQ
jgi:hypothetical protein